MKLLEIKDNQGYYLNGQNTLVPIDTITKEDLLRFVALTLTEDVELDEYNEEAIKNQAHQILYKNIFEKLRGLRDRREEFIDESERLYLEAHEKYQDNTS